MYISSTRRRRSPAPSWALLCLLAATFASGHVLQQRQPQAQRAQCAAGQKTCQSPEGPFCCPSTMTCGASKNQCLKVSLSRTTTTRQEPAPTATSPVAKVTATATVTPSPIPTQSATRESKPKSNKLRDFFTTKHIIIISSAGGSALLLFALLTCFCIHKRRQGRAIKEAYEDPTRQPYTSITAADARKRKANNGSTSNINLTAPADPPTPSATPRTTNTASPPLSPRATMAPAAPAGPLEQNHYGYRSDTHPYAPYSGQDHSYPNQYPFPKDPYSAVSAAPGGHYRAYSPVTPVSPMTPYTATSTPPPRSFSPCFSQGLGRPPTPSMYQDIYQRPAPPNVPTRGDPPPTRQLVAQQSQPDRPRSIHELEVREEGWGRNKPEPYANRGY